MQQKVSILLLVSILKHDRRMQKKINIKKVLVCLNASSFLPCIVFVMSSIFVQSGQ